MNLWNINELKESLSSVLIENKLLDNSIKIDEVFIDSRKKINNGLFIALKGENTDGHNFIKSAFESGAKIAIVDNIPNDIRNSDLINHLIVVSNTYEALNQLAIYSRKRTKAKIIALTGSVGKTGTKEMLKIAFESQGKTFATSGNLNNHIGLPLSLANMHADVEYGIFEMGMNHANEIIHLSKIAKPNIAIITNVGPVHIEFFKNEQEIAKAKSEIFAGILEDDIALINLDNHHHEYIYNQALNYGINKDKILNFGKNINADYAINAIKIIDANLSSIEASTKSKQFKYLIGCTNESVAFNSIIILACLDIIGKNISAGLDSLQKFKNLSGRGNLIEITANDKKLTIIDDSYNASILSMKAGLDNCIKIKNNLNKNRMICALGDMLELGDKSDEIHTEVLKYACDKNFDLIIAVGNKMELASKNIKSKNILKFANSTEAGEQILKNLADNDIIYIKGSRGTRMEKIIENLTKTQNAH